MRKTRECAAGLGDAEDCLLYTSDRFLPDKAIDVLDEAGARMRIRNMTLPKDVYKRQIISVAA